MKKITFMVLMAVSCMLFFAFTTTTGKKLTGAGTGSTIAPNLSSTKAATPAAGKNGLTEKRRQSTCTISFSQGSNVSGSWVLEMSGPGGTYQIPANRSVPVPYGTYSYIGIHAAGGTSQSYNISGSLCATSYSKYGTSALFSNVVVNCGSGSFSVN